MLVVLEKSPKGVKYIVAKLLLSVLKILLIFLCPFFLRQNASLRGILSTEIKVSKKKEQNVFNLICMQIFNFA